MKFSLALLVLGIVTYGVYSFTNRPDYDYMAGMDQTSLQGKLQSAQIYPKRAYASNALQLRIDGATRDEYSYLEVRWTRNGQPISNEATATLPARHTKKGDKIQATVNLLGPDALPDPVTTMHVNIGNSPPQIITATTAMRSMEGDILTIKLQAVDPDGDHLRYTYKWYRNDTQINGETRATLKLTEVNAGDKYYATVVAFDGEDETAVYKCDAIEMGGNAPMIVSEPPSQFTEDRRYVYQLEVKGASPEALKYELVEAPEGMTISDGGAINWGLPEAEVGSRAFKVAVRVYDSVGAEAVQEFSINLSAQAAN